MLLLNNYSLTLFNKESNATSIKIVWIGRSWVRILSHPKNFIRFSFLVNSFPEKIIKCLQLRKCFWIKTKILLLHKERRYFYVINIKKFVIVWKNLNRPFVMGNNGIRTHNLQSLILFIWPTIKEYNLIIKSPS